MDAKISELHHQTMFYLAEIKNLLTGSVPSQKVNVISYFTYSLNIAHAPGGENLCLGSYHIHNLGRQAMTTPHICIQLPEGSPFSFSGKYVYGDFKPSLKGADGWERTNEKTNKEEFWLKPLGKSSIEPNETLSFSNFQIKWNPIQSYAGSITGFTYSDQMKEGVAVMNPINLSGSVDVRADENE